ncbi:hypothetical protein P5V15_012531 [Pogonomyrmex californicus]
MKAHLYYLHKESNPEEDKKWRTMKIDPNSAWRYYTKDETFKAKCNVCKQISYAYYLRYLESHLISCHQTIIKNIQEEIKSSWLFKYFTFVDDQKKIKCSRCDIKLSIFLEKEGLEQHMLLHNINQYSETNRIDPNSAWRYYTKDETFRAKCNICKKIMKKGYVLKNLERHLITSHKTIIKNIQKDIKSSWLFKYLTFVDKQNEIKCSRCDDKLSIFLGTEGLKLHILDHNIIDPNSAWRYFKKDETFKAKCTVCDKQTKAYALLRLEEHLHSHKKIIKNIQEEIKSSWLFKYLTFVDEQKKVKCSRCNFKLSIFLGTEGLEQHMLLHDINQHSETNRTHLYYHHKESNPEEDEKWRTMKVDPNSAWRYYTKDETFEAKCNVCKKIVKNAYLLKVLESHLINRHQTIIKNIQEEIKSSWLFKYFTFVEEQKKVKCSRCDDKLSIFLGTEVNLQKQIKVRNKLTHLQ